MENSIYVRNYNKDENQYVQTVQGTNPDFYPDNSKFQTKNDQKQQNEYENVTRSQFASFYDS